MIKVGDKIPEINLRYKIDSKIEIISSKDIFSNRFVVMFGVPGAFTSTCSNRHLPGFIKNYKKILSFGIDEIACVSVNDPHVMHAWGEKNNTFEKISMYSDVDASFANSIDLAEDYGPNLLIRLKRFSLVAKNNIVQFFFTDPRGVFDRTSAEYIIKNLKNLKNTIY